MQLQNDIETIEAAGIQIIGISYDSVETLKEFADEKEITFRLLSDPDNQTIEAYGVLNEGAKGKQAGIPHPGTFLVAKDGKVAAFLPGIVPRRHSTQALLDAAESLE